MPASSNRENLAALIAEMLREIEACPGRDGECCRARTLVPDLEALARDGEAIDGSRALTTLDALVRHDGEKPNRSGPRCRTVYLAGHALGLAALLSYRGVNGR